MAINPWLELRARVVAAGERAAAALAAAGEAQIKANLNDRKRTGTLLNSWGRARLGPARYMVGSNLVYARIQELGGWIKPKNTTYLPVPIHPVLSPRIRKAAGTSLRNYPGPGHLVVRPSASGKLILYLAQGPASSASAAAPIRRFGLPDNQPDHSPEPDLEEMTPVFVLARAVYVPKKPYVRPALSALHQQTTGIVAAAFAGVFPPGNAPGLAPAAATAAPAAVGV